MSSIGYLEITRLLLLYGASVNSRAHNGETPLHFAASHGNTGVVGLLIGNGADVDSVDEDGRSPIWVAAFYGNSGALKAMLAARERKGVAANHSYATFVIIFSCCFKQTFFAVGSRSLKNGVSPMFAAAQEGHLEAVRLLFQAGESPDNDHNR